MPTVVVGVVVKAQRRALSRSGRALGCFTVIVTRLQLTQPTEVGLHVHDIGVSIIASGRNFLTPLTWNKVGRKEILVLRVRSTTTRFSTTFFISLLRAHPFALDQVCDDHGVALSCSSIYRHQ